MNWQYYIKPAKQLAIIIDGGLWLLTAPSLLLKWHTITCKIDCKWCGHQIHQLKTWANLNCVGPRYIVWLTKIWVGSNFQVFYSSGNTNYNYVGPNKNWVGSNFQSILLKWVCNQHRKEGTKSHVQSNN